MITEQGIFHICWILKNLFYHLIPFIFLEQRCCYFTDQQDMVQGLGVEQSRIKRKYYKHFHTTNCRVVSPLPASRHIKVIGPKFQEIDSIHFCHITQNQGTASNLISLYQPLATIVGNLVIYYGDLAYHSLHCVILLLPKS